jgi:hypothetical protein
MSESPQPGQMGEMTTRFARVDPGPSQGLGVVSVAVTVVGAALLVVAYTALNWYDGGGSSHVSDLHSNIDSAGAFSYAAPAKIYFGWLGWVLVVVAIAAALVAALPVIGRVFQIVAPVVAVVALAMTFLAIRLFTNDTGVGGPPDGYGDFLGHASIGFYLALGGFLLVGIGAAIGPSRKH